MRFPPNIRIALWLICWVATATAASASVSIYLGPDELAESSVAVVEGTVEDVRSGVDPETGRLSTYVTLVDLAVHRGPKSLDRIVLREAGGEFGDVALVIDSAPDYSPGEEVLVFASASADGALRTSGHFFGKFTRADDAAGWARDLRGADPTPSAPLAGAEWFSAGELASTVVHIAQNRNTHGTAWSATPPEFDRVEWAPDSSDGVRFAPFSWTHPSRWPSATAAEPVRFQIDPTGHPLGDDDQLMQALADAAESWRYVPEASVSVSVDPSPVSFVATHETSPQEIYYPDSNVVLFGDPYDELPDPVNCAGILAVGGYWRGTETVGQVNGIDYYPILQAYVIFNQGIECFLQGQDDLAEIAAHELGHALGFGHSGHSDSIMRASPYGARGARLGADDLDAAHCWYPHPLELVSPAAGERFVAGARLPVRWKTGEEPDSMATVEIHLSQDAGESWSILATDIADDGEWSWTPAETPTGDLRLRIVRPHNSDETWSQQPDYCSGDTTAGSFRTVEAPKSHRLFDGRREQLTQGAGRR